MRTKQLQNPHSIKSAGLYLIILALLISCKSGQVNLFKPGSPHEQYQRKLVASGLDKTSMGSAWILSSLSVFQKALNITIPYQETGYFPAESVSATAYRFNVVQGQKISIQLSRKAIQPFIVYIDIWEQPQNGQMKLIAAADTINQSLEFEAKTSGPVLIRLQPELLRGGQYTLNINTGPSLGFPVKSSNSSHIKSIFGDGRDENSRKHEGIDIFAAFRTPAIAAARGTITRVNENNLGGKVVWLRPMDKDYTLYYAHLDLQTAKEGQQVLPGDTIGLVGNTGNAKYTPSHLHFGIYSSGGAVDPLPFVNTAIKKAPVISSALSNLNATMRTRGNTTLYESTDKNGKTITSLQPGTIVKVNSANSSWYKIELPNGQPGFIQAQALTGISKALLRLKITSAGQELYDYPDNLNAAVKLTLKAGTQLEVLGNYDNYQLVKSNTDETGWIDKLP